MRKPRRSTAGLGSLTRILAVFGLLASLSVNPSSGADEGPAPGLSSLTESERVDVVEAWPFVVKASSPKYEDACANLRSEDLRVTEGGREARVVDVSRALPLSTQILMIDASGSMMNPNMIVARKKDRQAKAAARAYVDWMLDDANDAASRDQGAVELIVVTFDDDLLMVVPPTIVADGRTALALQARIDAIVGGFYTTFYDSLFRLTGYVGARGGRTAVFVLSDGADYGSMYSSISAIDRIEETNNVSFFPISIGEVTSHHAEFMRRISRISGGKSFELRGQRSDSLAAPLQRRFEEIRARLKSQLYVSYLTEPPGALASDAKTLNDKNQIRRSLSIRSTDKRCSIPQNGYRSTRTLMLGTAEKPLPTSGGRGKITRTLGPNRSATIELVVEDTLLDPGPLLESFASRPKAIAVRRMLELVAPPIETDPDLPHRLERAVERRPLDVVRDWMLDGSIPASGDSSDGVPPRVMNGKAFLDLRFVLAEALFTQLETYRSWLLAKIEHRVRHRFLTRVPPPSDPSERERYETSLGLIVQRALAEATWQDYLDDTSTWLGDVRGRDLAMELMVHEANTLIREGASAKPEVDRLQEQWSNLHAWLYFPESVRVLVLLELSCSVERNQCGFYRIVRPRLSELPEDLNKAYGKTAEPSSFEEYEVFYGAKVPKHPFGLMLLRWILGLPVEPASSQLSPERIRLADELRTHWRVASIDQAPEDVIEGRKRPRKGAHVLDRCRRRVELVLESVDDGTTRTSFTFRVEGYVEAESLPVDPARFRDVCEEADRIRFVPGCFQRGAQQAGQTLQRLLTSAGLEACPGS